MWCVRVLIFSRILVIPDVGIGLAVVAEGTDLAHGLDSVVVRAAAAAAAEVMVVEDAVAHYCVHLDPD